jgi:hypothetical protein
MCERTTPALAGSTSGAAGRSVAATLLENISGNEAGCRDDQGGDDDRVVDVADHRDEIRDEVDGTHGVRDGGAEKPAGKAWGSGMFQGEVIDPDLVPEPGKE